MTARGMGRVAPRVAGRGVVVHSNRLLVVNAWPNGQSDLWCAPGGGLQAGESLPDCVAREIAEETGLSIQVGQPCLVNEFHDPAGSFHQVEVFFRCMLQEGEEPTLAGWTDPEGIVTDRRWITRPEAQKLRLKPESLRLLPWTRGFGYDPLEPFVM